MTINTPKYLTLELSGTPYQIGYQHGSALKDKIHKVVFDNLEALKQTATTRGFVSIDERGLLNLSYRYLPYAEEYAPELVDELRGISAGSGVSFEDLFMFNCQMELHDLTYPLLAQQVMFGCTTFGVTPEACADGGPIIGQNFDWGMTQQEAVVFLKINPEQGVPVIVFTVAGMLGCNGMNGSGLSLVINRLTTTDSRAGVPFPFLVRKVLQQTILGDAVYAASRAHRASGAFFLMGEHSGTIAGMELTAKDYEIIYPAEGLISHANHYSMPRMQQYNRYARQFFGDTLVRYSRMNRLLKWSRGKVSLDNIKEITTDHVNHPYSICRHPDDLIQDELDKDKDTFTRRPCNISQTITSIATDPAAGRFLYTYGPPCESDYEETGF